LAKLLLFGNIVHLVLEENVDKNKKLDIEELTKSYQESRPKFDPENKISEELISVGQQILNEYYDRHSEEEVKTAHKEKGFNFVIGSFNINGFIDRIDEYKDRICIIDYKTGKWEAPIKSIKDNLQLGIYALAASQMYPDKEIYAELYYLRSRPQKRSYIQSRRNRNCKRKNY